MIMEGASTYISAGLAGGKQRLYNRAKASNVYHCTTRKALNGHQHTFLFERGEELQRLADSITFKVRKHLQQPDLEIHVKQ